MILFVLVGLSVTLKSESVEGGLEQRVFTDRKGGNHPVTRFSIYGDQISLTWSKRGEKQRSVKMPISDLSDADLQFLERWKAYKTEPGNPAGTVDLNSDLVLALFFDGWARDYGGNGNHCRTYRLSYVEDRFGRPNQAAIFPGLMKKVHAEWLRKGNQVRVQEALLRPDREPPAFSSRFLCPDISPFHFCMGAAKREIKYGPHHLPPELQGGRADSRLTVDIPIRSRDDWGTARLR